MKFLIKGRLGASQARLRRVMAGPPLCGEMKSPSRRFGHEDGVTRQGGVAALDGG
jgi:hypothetical protein